MARDVPTAFALDRGAKQCRRPAIAGSPLALLRGSTLVRIGHLRPEKITRSVVALANTFCLLRSIDFLNRSHNLTNSLSCISISCGEQLRRRSRLYGDWEDFFARV